MTESDGTFWADHSENLKDPKYCKAFCEATTEINTRSTVSNVGDDFYPFPSVLSALNLLGQDQSQSFNPMFGCITVNITNDGFEVTEIDNELDETIGDRDIFFDGLEEFDEPGTYDLNVMLSGYLEDGAAFVTIL